ncbi:MAG TPA: hypothetical protein VMS18_20710 [Candidatus Binatia bacterium]|nr:hypothetical protein [Candidatus Binatia bacterium]
MSVYVVFFGGFKASKIDMELWLASANSICGGDVVYDAFPYPDGARSGDTAAVNGFKQFDTAIKKVEGSSADTIYIVGHSSGCAIANELNSRIKGDHSRITLVDLDGFAPSVDQIRKSSHQVWSAEGAKGGKSLHHDDWGRFQGQLQVYTASSATNIWSLHFSLVNTAATNAIKSSSDEDLKKGYAGCIANLCWLR